MAESPKLLHSSAMDLLTRLWGRYHVPQNVFLVVNKLPLFFNILSWLLICTALIIVICESGLIRTKTIVITDYSVDRFS